MAKSVRSKSKVANSKRLRDELYHRTVERQRRLAAVARKLVGNASKLDPVKMELDGTVQIADKEIKAEPQAEKEGKVVDASVRDDGVESALCNAIIEQKSRPIWMSNRKFKRAKKLFQQSGVTQVKGIGKANKHAATKRKEWSGKKSRRF